MPPRSRICSVENCGRRHHAKGFCRRHYGQHVRKTKTRERSSSLASQEAQKYGERVRELILQGSNWDAIPPNVLQHIYVRDIGTIERS